MKKIVIVGMTLFFWIIVAQNQNIYAKSCLCVDLKPETGYIINLSGMNFPQQIERNSKIGNFIGCKIKIRFSDGSEKFLNGGKVISSGNYELTNSGIQELTTIGWVALPFYDFGGGDIRQDPCHGGFIKFKFKVNYLPGKVLGLTVK
ncbi:MAG: hypothetical protein GWO87_01985 [Xanthomonadaceae bacterium]|nr:hypothetical protein [Rhodospirillaceae bacterium]NIA17940.1 hypothetical protein [Xanthomonadaceae bacterium]